VWDNVTRTSRAILINTRALLSKAHAAGCGPPHALRPSARAAELNVLGYL
jgi:hypothetical protein